MSMVSLTIAPLLAGKRDWESWYFGLIPFGIFVLVTGYLASVGILTWEDPLQSLDRTATPSKTKSQNFTLEIPHCGAPLGLLLVESGCQVKVHMVLDGCVRQAVGATLQSGDVICSINGQAVNSLKDYYSSMATSGSFAKLQCLRPAGGALVSIEGPSLDSV